MKAGAVEFLTKPFRDQELLDAVQVGLERDRTRREKDTMVSNLRGRYETLTPREQEVLTLRFGLADGYSRTLEEVGRKFRVTRERIRQIEAKALRKMRHPTRIRKLEGFLEGAD